MLLLLVALVVTAFALVRGLAPSRWGGIYGSASWFLVFYCAFVMYGYIKNFIDAGLPDYGPMAKGLTVATVGLLSVMVGVTVLNRKTDVYGGGPRVMVETGDRDLVIMSLVILVPAWLYFALLGNVPLFLGIEAVGVAGSDGIGALQQARLERDPYVNAQAKAIPLQGLLEIFRNVGTPAVLAATILRWRANGFRRLYLALTLISVVTVMAAGQKWPLQYLLFAIVFALALDTGDLPRRPLVILGSVGLILGSLLNILQGRAGAPGADGLPGQIWSGVEAVLDRTFLGYVETSILSYGIQDGRLQDLGGASYLQSLVAYLPGLGHSFSVDFFAIVNNSSRGFTAPPDFATEWYINWGMVGVVIGGFAWGVFLNRVDAWLRRRKYSPETAGLAAITILSLATVTTSGLMTSLRVLFIAIPVLGAIRIFGGPPRQILTTSRGVTL